MTVVERISGRLSAIDRKKRDLAARHGARVLLALGLAVATFLMFPGSPIGEIPFHRVGAVAREDVIAPFAFRVPKSPPDLERERTDAMRRVEGVFEVAPASAATVRSVVGRVEAIIREAPDAASLSNRLAAMQIRLTSAEAAHLVDASHQPAFLAALDRAVDAATRGVADPTSLLDVGPAIVIRGATGERRAELDSVPLVRDLVQQARRDYRRTGGTVGESALGKVLTHIVSPTLVPERTMTARRRQDAARMVDPYRFEVREGEKIIGAHDVVGRETFQKLAALRSEVDRRQEGRGGVARVVGSILSNMLLLLVFGFVVLLFRRPVYGSMRALGTIALCFLIVIGGAALIARLEPVRPELIPIGLAAIVISVLFDPRISVVGSLVLAVLIGGQSAYRGTDALFLTVIAGATAAFSVRALRRRSHAYVPIIAITAAYMLGALAIKLTVGQPMGDLGQSIAWGALNAVLSVGLAMMVLPAAEDLAGIDTDLKLLEWSDLNRPLMRRLSLEAPGTYAHTMAMANLAEAACTAIGANGLLARVGAYYHDIGKLKRPTFFIENQPRGRNPHDNLKPKASAEIIRSHITDGLALAAEHRIPQAVRAFISEHHGTGDLAYFREKAREEDGQHPQSGEFSYPGPVPQTAETAVVMLADGVEAATRVLADPSPKAIREVVDHIVNQRLTEGQLREAPLTLGQIERIKQQFTRVLTGSYHNRIDYPRASGGITAEFGKVT